MNMPPAGGGTYGALPTHPPGSQGQGMSPLIKAKRSHQNRPESFHGGVGCPRSVQDAASLFCGTGTAISMMRIAIFPGSLINMIRDIPAHKYVVFQTVRLEQ